MVSLSIACETLVFKVDLKYDPLPGSRVTKLLNDLTTTVIELSYIDNVLMLNL